MPTADGSVGDGEANALFRGLEDLPGLVLAVSGGPDSTALLVLAARWAKRLKRAPKLVAVTIDHGLRPQAAREAAMVKRLARRLGVPHRTLHWRGRKPRTGLQEAARYARYALLAQVAMRARFAHILTAHTLDDQAETVLFRLARGSGLFGLTGMAHAAPLPLNGVREIFLVRPLLHLPKARLVATLKAERIAYAEDPSNHDPRFTRARLRSLMPALAREGLDARGLARLAAGCGAPNRPSRSPCRPRVPRSCRCRGRRMDRSCSRPRRSPSLPAEVGLRLLGEAVAHSGDEGAGRARQARKPLRGVAPGALPPAPDPCGSAYYA